MEKLRLFIAVDIDKEGLAKIKSFQDRMRAEKTEVRWTRPDTWHVTLKFLGETDSAKVKEIEKICNEIRISHAPIPLEINGVSGFPGAKAPRVLFVNLKESEELKRLAWEIESGVEKLGFQKENRPFHPHVTIGRIKDAGAFLGTSKDFLPVFTAEGKKLLHEFTASEFYLYESKLSKSGPEYTRLLSFDF